ncbi:hypothetical protein Tsubulata_032971 [Turnera subulata]|uniref:F-box domain-containing protein n=1 Tax=Turnera subulata TaxID=218843 RepID=A0A9Q0FBQ4_9ROSI|nr:hypothetical protein Tsubulata_032971 [Turnera subulata]
MAVINGSLLPYLGKKLAGVFVNGKKTKVDLFESLPDEIIIEILSCIPAESVLECQRVCKRWRALTRRPYFAELQVMRATPTVIAECVDGGKTFYINVNNNAEKGRSLMRFLDRVRKPNLEEINSNLPRPRLQPNCGFVGSCNGLILGKRGQASWEYFLYNPITLEEITFPKIFPHGYVCGFFFCPETKEYKMLHTYLKGDAYQYVIIDLPTFSQRELTQFYCSPSAVPLFTLPTIANGNLHWMVEHRTPFESKYYKLKTKIDDHPCANSILRFNTQTENIDIMPHPGCDHCPGPSYGRMQLLEADGKLSMCHIRGELVDVWFLEDYPTWNWIRRYNFSITSICRWIKERSRCCVVLDLLHSGGFNFEEFTDFVWIHNDEVLLSLASEGLFAYNLKLNTIKEIKSAGIKDWNVYKLYSHTKSLVSLRKF